MKNIHQNQSRIQWLVRTAVLIALLISLQWATAGTQAFAGQYITGSLVNCVLAVASLYGGFFSGIVVALLSPFFAFLLGIGPKLLPIVPCIALGNGVYVALLSLLGKKAETVWKQAFALVFAAAAKFLTLYFTVVQLLLPALASALKAPQIKTFTVMFSWPQLVTALLGGALALLVVPVLKRAMKNPGR